ncbi:uncharacterized protein LOC120706458 [Panicum virgatum]|uniref:Uncharacterized protein n=1 Tax=Panicum virgatum TaxID=38727 RepID=A0A8T0SEP5_PANVG|nr:uncharacterized protein LOC120706458 [Panicum virgatum]KAG2596657.1 hypothetical protein PVAP13_5KG177300 [Panicum virgatum]
MASIVLLLSELLGGESASVLAADRYITGGGRLGLGEFRPTVAEAPAPAPAKRGAAAEGAPGQTKQGREQESFEDLAVPRIAVDVMWP